MYTYIYLLDVRLKRLVTIGIKFMTSFRWPRTDDVTTQQDKCLAHMCARRGVNSEWFVYKCATELGFICVHIYV